MVWGEGLLKRGAKTINELNIRGRQTEGEKDTHTTHTHTHNYREIIKGKMEQRGSNTSKIPD